MLTSYFIVNPSDHMSAMGRNIASFVVICFILEVSNSAFIDTLQKCSISNYDCQAKAIQKGMKEIGESGWQELGIDTIDPYKIRNVVVSVENVVNITLIDGVVRGIKDCKLKKFEANIEKGMVKQELLCNLVVTGHYKLKGASPAIESILGGSVIHGEGKTKVVLEKLLLKFSYPFRVEKHDDGEIYFQCDPKSIQHEFEILGKASFDIDNIYLGKEDVSKMVVGLLNQDSKGVLKNFGHAFVKKGVEICLEIMHSFFSKVPAKHYIIEDLTPYLKN